MDFKSLSVKGKYYYVFTVSKKADYDWEISFEVERFIKFEGSEFEKYNNAMEVYKAHKILPSFKEISFGDFIKDYYDEENDIAKINHAFWSIEMGARFNHEDVHCLYSNVNMDREDMNDYIQSGKYDKSVITKLKNSII